MRHTKLNLIETILTFAVIVSFVSSTKLFDKLKNLHDYQGLAQLCESSVQSYPETKKDTNGNITNPRELFKQACQGNNFTTLASDFTDKFIIIFKKALEDYKTQLVDKIDDSLINAISSLPEKTRKSNADQIESFSRTTLLNQSNSRAGFVEYYIKIFDRLESIYTDYASEQDRKNTNRTVVKEPYQYLSGEVSKLVQYSSNKIQYIVAANFLKFTEASFKLAYPATTQNGNRVPEQIVYEFRNFLNDNQDILSTQNVSQYNLAYIKHKLQKKYLELVVSNSNQICNDTYLISSAVFEIVYNASKSPEDLQYFKIKPQITLKKSRFETECQEDVTTNNITRKQDRPIYKQFQSKIKTFVKVEEFAPNDTEEVKLQYVYDSQTSKSGQEETQYITGHNVIVMTSSVMNSQEIQEVSLYSSQLRFIDAQNLIKEENRPLNEIKIDDYDKTDKQKEQRDYARSEIGVDAVGRSFLRAPILGGLSRIDELYEGKVGSVPSRSR